MTVTYVNKPKYTYAKNVQSGIQKAPTTSTKKRSFGGSSSSRISVRQGTSQNDRTLTPTKTPETAYVPKSLAEAKSLGMTQTQYVDLLRKQLPERQTPTSGQKVTYSVGGAQITKYVREGQDPQASAPSIPIFITDNKASLSNAQRKDVTSFEKAGGNFKYEQVPKGEVGGFNVFTKTKAVAPVTVQRESWWREKIEKPVTESKYYKATFGAGADLVLNYYKDTGLKQTSFMSVLDKPGKKYFDKEFDIGVAEGISVYSNLRAKQKTTSEFSRGLAIGYVEFKRDYPVAGGALFALGATLPPGIGYGASKASAGLTSLGVSAGGVKAIGTGVQVGLAAGATYLTTKEIQKGEGAFGKGQVIGRMVATAEPVVMGGLVGSEVIPKVQSKIRTIGRERIATEKVVPQKIISGEQRFYEAPKSQHARLFKESGRLYHATSEKLSPELIVGKGKSEIEGLYGAPKVSPNFLRTGTSEVAIGEWKPGSQPMVASIQPVGFQVNPGASKYPRILGVADIPLIKTEVEAVLPPGTALIKTAGSKYFTYQGFNVPIDEYAVAGKEFIKTGSASLLSGFDSISGLGSGASTRALPTTSKLSPSSFSILFGGSSLSRSKKSSSSVPSFKQSVPVSFKSTPFSSISSTPSPSAPSIVSPSSTSYKYLYITPSSSSSSRRSIIPSIPSSPTSIPSITRITTIKSPPAINFDFDSTTRRTVKAKKGRQPKRYTPTLTSAGFNIFGKPSRIGITSGFGIRPLIRKRRKKR